ADIGVLFTQDPDALEDPDSYPLPPEATVIDLTPAVREELLLAVPQFLECRPDCRGRCPRCGQDLNAGPCGSGPATRDTARAGRWARWAGTTPRASRWKARCWRCGSSRPPSAFSSSAAPPRSRPP